MFLCTGNSTKLFQRRPIATLSLLLMLAMVAMHGRAQSTQGAVIGSVRDPGGAVVPGANVTLTNTDEGTARTAKSNGVGDYRFLDVKAGTIPSASMLPALKSGQLPASLSQSARNCASTSKLAVGAVQQSVQVTGDSVSAIETDSPTISGDVHHGRRQQPSREHARQLHRHQRRGHFRPLPGVQATAPASRCKAHCPIRWK